MINATPMQDLLASFLNVVGVAPGTLARLPDPALRPGATPRPWSPPPKAAADGARVDAEAGRLLRRGYGEAVTERDVHLADGRTLHVYDSGGDGEVVVWHHGSPQTGAPLAPVLEAARERGLRHVSYGRPSYGGSSPQPGRDVAGAARDVEQLADALGFERFATLGASGGGPHALACAALLGSG